MAKIVNKAMRFFSKKECKKIIDYFKSNKDKIKQWNNTFLLQDEKIPFRDKLIDFVTKQHNVKFNYLQVVKWPDGSFMKNHYDGEAVEENDYTCICYLNSNYKGGRTIVENKFIKNNIGDFIFFNSKKILHGVEQVKGTRYTMISWYQKTNGYR